MDRLCDCRSSCSLLMRRAKFFFLCFKNFFFYYCSAFPSWYTFQRLPAGVERSFMFYVKTRSEPKTFQKLFSFFFFFFVMFITELHLGPWGERGKPHPVTFYEKKKKKSKKKSKNNNQRLISTKPVKGSWKFGRVDRCSWYISNLNFKKKKKKKLSFIPRLGKAEFRREL